MYDFITAGQNIVFAIVLTLLLAFFAIELCGLLFGATISGVLGELDLPDIDVDLGADLDIGVFTKFLYWLKIGRVPLLILLVIFMATFVICGYVLQYLCLAVMETMLPAWLASGAALFITIPAVRLCGGFLVRLVPKDETAAISRDDLVGGRAVIVLGSARQGSPAQARTSDRYGTTHYLMIEPDNPEETLERGKDLLLVRHNGTIYYAINHPEPNLPDNS